jgi:hypothetical protein
MILKEEHTFRVCDLILDIGHSLGLTAEELLVAECIALFHDLGRFLQFQQYGTFADAKSINHAHLAVQILHEQHWLDLVKISAEYQQLIDQSILVHNQPQLPSNLDPNTHKFAQLIRDADKLDIYFVVTQYYLAKLHGIKGSQEENESIELGLSQSEKISPKVMTAITQKQIVLNPDLQTVNDFKMLQMAWVYDLNFPRSFQLLHDRQYLAIIQQTLPVTPEIHAICNIITQYVEKHRLTKTNSPKSKH